MVTVTVLVLGAILMEVARWFARQIAADGYGHRPPPESHCDPFPGRRQL
ncbi:MAG: hypothetical protein M3P89_12835 [Actinomycetota bacterium]|nr:hypothetical protein [Actinomycetota bacterium]